MTDDSEAIRAQTTQGFSLRQVTRSSGRVRGLALDFKSRHGGMSSQTDAHADFVKIYRRFLDLQDEESSDLCRAISYGLRLLGKGPSKAATDETGLLGNLRH